MISRDEIFEYAKNKYDVFPNYPWFKSPNHAVLRHKNNRKWFGLIAEINENKFGLDSENFVDILNIKSAPIMIGAIIDNVSIFPAWHMNREHWVTILTASFISKEKVYSLIDLSYELTAKP